MTLCGTGAYAVTRIGDTKIMMVNISTIYTISKLRLFPTIHCKWHQILVKFQKILGGGGGRLTPPPPLQLKGLAALASFLSNLETPLTHFLGATLNKRILD